VDDVCDVHRLDCTGRHQHSLCGEAPERRTALL
jgi:hypothetical protein